MAFSHIICVFAHHFGLAPLFKGATTKWLRVLSFSLFYKILLPFYLIIVSLMCLVNDIFSLQITKKSAFSTDFLCYLFVNFVFYFCNILWVLLWLCYIHFVNLIFQFLILEFSINIS